MFITEAEANAKGYATCNDKPHLCVDAPDGDCTITVKTSDGRRITFAFLSYTKGGPADCVDVIYPDNGAQEGFGSSKVDTFDVLCFGRGRTVFDSRKAEHKPCVVSVLIERKA